MANDTNTNKPKSLIRWNAIIPFFIISFLFSIYFHFFFHSHAKRLLEFTGTLINKAEVNIGSFRANIFNASFEFKNIQITNPQDPQKNSLEIDRIYFEALWDALLRGKLVAEEAHLEGLALDTLRKKTGYVLNSPQKNNSTNPGTQNSKKKSSDNIITNMASLTQMDSIGSLLLKEENSLQTTQEISKLQKQITTKEKYWKKEFKSLPNQEKIKSFEKRLKKIKTSNFKNIKELHNSLNRAHSLLNEFNKDYKLTQKTLQSLTSDFTNLKKDISDLQKITEKDVENLERKLKIPSLKASDISQSLFQKTLEPYLEKFERLMQMAEKYMPPVKTPEQIAQDRQKGLPPQERHKGRNYQFSRPNSYPLIWIKRIKISAQRKTTQDNRTLLHGEILNLTTNPSQISQPMSFSLKGDLPEEKIYGVKLQLNVDHRQQTPEQILDFSVDRYPTPTQKIANSPDVKLYISNPEGKFSLRAVRKERLSSISLNNTYSSLKYQVNAKNKDLRDLLSQTMKGLPQVKISTQVHGVFPNWQWNISSNIAEDLQKSFQKQLKLKITSLKKRLRQKVENQVLSEKKQLKKNLEDFENRYLKDLQKLSRTLNSSQKQVQNKINKAKKSQELKAKKKIQKEIEKALKSKDGQKLLKDLKKGLGL